MIPAVIADDENWILSLLKGLINWSELGIEIVGEARNGHDALKLCRGKRSEILVTDVRMPGLSGLQMIHEVRTSLPNLEIVVISGYDSFEYVQAAMRESVLDYILKPVNKAQTEEALARAVSRVLQRKKKAGEIQQLQSTLRKLENAIGGEHEDVVPSQGIDPRIARVCEYLVENFEKNVSLAEAAERCFLNRTYFSEVFKRETGQGYSQYVLNLKMRKAKELLTRSELRVCEIAGSLGYSDPNYFDRVFKKEWGGTPEQFRASTRRT